MPTEAEMDKVKDAFKHDRRPYVPEKLREERFKELKPHLNKRQEAITAINSEREHKIKRAKEDAAVAIQGVYEEYDKAKQVIWDKYDKLAKEQEDADSA